MAGSSIMVSAPVDTIPLFVKAGSIIPMGTPVESTNEVQAIAKIRVYPGADASFDLYNDDGSTYAYEQGKFEVAKLKWDDAAGKFSAPASKYIGETEKNLVEVIGR